MREDGENDALVGEFSSLRKEKDGEARGKHGSQKYMVLHDQRDQEHVIHVDSSPVIPMRVMQPLHALVYRVY